MKLGKKVTNPGELTKLISLQSSDVTKVSGGQKVEYTTRASVYAKWVNAHGGEGTASGSLQALKTATVTIRYYADLDTTWAILKGTERYRVLSVDNIRERNEYMELQVQLIVGSV